MLKREREFLDAVNLIRKRIDANFEVKELEWDKSKSRQEQLMFDSYRADAKQGRITFRDNFKTVEPTFYTTTI